MSTGAPDPVCLDLGRRAAEAAGRTGPLVGRFEAMRAELGGREGHEADRLRTMLRAFHTRARVVDGEEIPWVAQVRDASGVEVDRIAPELKARLAEDLRGALAAVGETSPLEQAVQRWTERTRVPAGDLPRVAQHHLEDARARSDVLLPELPATTDIRLEIVHDVFYSGYKEYLGDHAGECRLNGDQPWSRPRLRPTVAHEAYPGHHAISSIREAQGRAGRLTGGALLYCAGTPLTPVIEGVCEVACRRLGWAWDEDPEVYERLNRYRKAVFTDVAGAVNRDGLGHDEAVATVEREAFTTRASAEARWTFVTHPLWRTSFPHYWYGTEGVRDALAQLDAAGHGVAWTQLTHAHPHDLATLTDAARDWAGRDGAVGA